MQIVENYILPKRFNLHDLCEDYGAKAIHAITPEVLQKAFMFVTLIIHIDEVTQYPSGGRRFIQLSNKFLARFIGKDYVSQVSDLLDDLGVVECDYTYSEGVKSFGYRLTCLYASQPIVEDLVGSHRILERIQAYNAEQRKAGGAIRGIYAKMRKNLQLFQFSEKGCQLVLEKRGIRRRQRVRSLELVQEQRSYFTKATNSGRCFHALSSTPKEMRDELLIEGEETIRIDLPSTQPYLASVLYDRAEEAHMSERAEYFQFIQGDFYNNLYDLAGLKHLSRRAMKKSCFAKILYGRTTQPRGKLWSAFEAKFPILAQLILNERKRTAKKDTQRPHFAVRLQKAEADIVIHNVGKKMVDAGIPFAVVHDEIICRRNQSRVVRKWMREAFDEALGVKLGIKF